MRIRVQYEIKGDYIHSRLSDGLGPGDRWVRCQAMTIAEFAEFRKAISEYRSDAHGVSVEIELLPEGEHV